MQIGVLLFFSKLPGGAPACRQCAQLVTHTLLHLCSLVGVWT